MPEKRYVTTDYRGNVTHHSVRRMGGVIASTDRDRHERINARLERPNRAIDRDAAEAAQVAAHVAVVDATNRNNFLAAALELYDEEIAAKHLADARNAPKEADS